MDKIRITRRELLRGAVASAGWAIVNPARAASGAKSYYLAAWSGAEREDITKEFRVVLPSKIAPLPEGVLKYPTAPGFKLRGIKGLTWVSSQYLAEIPVMAKYKMNFLMNCYTSLWNLEMHGNWGQIPHGKEVNHWQELLPEEKRRGYARVVQECRHHGIEFCFSMNPILASPRPFDYDRPQDLELLWRHYAWMQGLGVRWFNLSLDDIRQGINATAQAKVTNEILRRLRTGDSGAQMIFTPTWYAGTGDSGTETAAKLGAGDTPGVRYLKEVGEKMDSGVYFYWTGPKVCSLSITREDAEKYKSLSKHRLLIWDNYPCNDQYPTLQLGPLMGRSSDLSTVTEGYISNPLSPQNEANRIPMLTIADYTWNPKAYDPARSIGQSVAHLGQTTGQRLALKDLVELYPGRLVARSQSTAWNSLLERFGLILDNGSQNAARDLIDRAESVSRRMAKEFPGQFVLARKTLDADISRIRAEYTKKYS